MRYALALVLVFLVTAVQPLHAAPGAEFAVKAAGVVLRAQPRETANGLLTLNPQHRLVEFERRGDWVRVGVFREVGAFGWVPAEDLVPLPRAVPQTAPAPEVPPPGAEPPAPLFLLLIDGTPALLFRGSCTLFDAGGAPRTVELSGHVPRSYRFDGAALDCRLRKWDAVGRFRIRLFQGERLLAERLTSGPFNQIWVRSAGPWGAAHAILRGGLAIDSNDKSQPPPGMN
jgi:hypothetical protein